MKKWCLLAAMLLPAGASASDLAISYSVSGISIGTIGTATRLELDLTFHGRYISAAGVVFFGSYREPTSGTCATTANGGAICNLQVVHTTLSIGVAPGGETGAIFAKDFTGAVIGSGSIALAP